MHIDKNNVCNFNFLLSEHLGDEPEDQLNHMKGRAVPEKENSN